MRCVIMNQVTRIDANSVIKPGMLIVIEIESKNGEKTVLKSMVHETYFEKNVLKIAMPSLKGRFIPLPKGDSIYVTALSDKVVYAFGSRVLDYGRDESNFLVMYITIPDKVRRIQRRRFVRIPIVLNGTYTVPGDDKEYSFLTRDFSAGGMLMCTKNILSVGQPISVNMDLGGIRLTSQKAQIVRSNGKNETTGLYEYGVQFLDLSTELEKSLVVFVFQQELKMKKASSGEEAGH
ncbi:MAG TPA: pilus assembly protein PilZ [Pseudothermotoga sp.]|nr:pilus assembly protein PilZ [Pseudothermotoga sp.]